MGKVCPPEDFQNETFYLAGDETPAEAKKKLVDASAIEFQFGEAI